MMFLRLCQIVKEREFNLRTYKFTVMPYFPLGGVSVCLVNQFGKCATKQDPELSPINRYGSTVAKFLTVHRSEKVV